MSGAHAAKGSDLARLDRLARSDSPIHALDPRAKLLAVLAFALAVVSMDKYALGDLLPFFLFPIFLWARSGVSLGLVAGRTLAVAPFALMVGLFNPWLDRQVLLVLGGVDISGGWVSLLSILLRGLLSISALVLLAATTDIPSLGQAARKLGVPSVFVSQMLGLYRYLFLLSEEVQRTHLAWRLRAPETKAPGWKVFAAILGQLLLRSLDRAKRVHQAMALRGFQGVFPYADRLVFRAADGWFLAGWGAALLLVRFGHPAQWLGGFVIGSAR